MDDNGQSGVTLDELHDTVANGFDGLSSVTADGFNMVGGRLDDVLSGIQSLQNTEGSTSTGTFALDQQQIETLQSGISVLTTETFLLVVLLAVLCGLTGWMILSHGWHR